MMSYIQQLNLTSSYELVFKGIHNPPGPADGLRRQGGRMTPSSPIIPASLCHGQHTRIQVLPWLLQVSGFGKKKRMEGDIGRKKRRRSFTHQFTVPYPLALVNPTEMATTKAGSPTEMKQEKNGHLSICAALLPLNRIIYPVLPGVILAPSVPARVFGRD